MSIVVMDMSLNQADRSEITLPEEPLPGKHSNARREFIVNR